MSMLFSKKLSIVLSTLILSACGNLSQVSKDGTTDNPKWPQINSTSFNHDGSQNGSWPEKEAIRLIEAGMNKDQIYNLIGRPHFSEGIIGVREWDYVFNYRENGEHKICQFKILFDKNMDARSFFWLPENCGLYTRTEKITSAEVKAESNKITHELSGDVLFNFDSAILSAEGEKIISEIAQQFRHQNGLNISIEGYTDRLGSEAYNQKLSLQRAEAVKTALVNAGISASVIQTIGLGASVQVKECVIETGYALRECLKPNRRVVININN